MRRNPPARTCRRRRACTPASTSSAVSRASRTIAWICFRHGAYVPTSRSKASAPAPTTPEIEVGNATTLPAPVPEPEDADKPLEPKTPAAPAPQEETTPLQDYATYEATKDISDPNTAAVAGAAAAQVAGALQ